MVVFAYPSLLWVGVFLIGVCVIIHWYVTSRQRYFFPALRVQREQAQQWLEKAVPFLRLLACVFLVIALARPRRELQRVYDTEQGISMMMVLDVSGSMELYDDPHDKRTRWSVAQQEALRFIAQRPHDAFGVTLFAACAVTRCPLTHDKELVTSIIRESNIGTVINPQDTLFLQGLLLAAKKLSTASSKEKVIIALTDGMPSAHDADPQVVLDYLKQERIKVYTIGIGGDQGGYMDHPWYGTVSVPTPLNTQLLTKIATDTGGKFFEARNPHALAQIYDTINHLETSDLAIPRTVVYQEYFIYFLWAAAGMLLLEWCLAWILRWL